MQTADGRWTVRVGGVGSVTWYRLEGPDMARNLPSMTALTDAGVDLGQLREVGQAA